MYDRFMATSRFASLDGLRALAILAVLWHHSGIPQTVPILGRGQMGVYLFFAISGFLITSLLIRERLRSGTISMRGFYTRRSLRIFPLYYAVLLLYVVLVPFLEHGPERPEFFANLPYYVTYTSNWFVTLGDDGRAIFFFAWSLATEEQFYLTWPWVEKYVKPAWRWTVLGVVAALVAATHFSLLLWLIPANWFVHDVMWSVAPPILLGVAGAHMLHSRKGFDLLARVFGQRWDAPIVFAVLLMLLALPASAATDYLVYVVLAGLVVACVVREDNGLARLLQLPPLVRLGVVSYGVYLLHMLSFAAVEKAGAKMGIGNQWVLWLVGIAAVYGAAEISFATFERFFLQLKPRLAPVSLPVTGPWMLRQALALNSGAGERSTEIGLRARLDW